MALTHDKNTNLHSSTSAVDKGKKRTSLFSLFTPPAWLRSEQARYIFGLVILFLAMMTGVGMCSFMVTGKADQAILEHLPLYKIFFPDNGVENWTGAFGAFAAEYLMNRWLGLPVLLYVVLIGRVGLNMVQNTPHTLTVSKFLRTSLWVVWMSLFLSSVCYLSDYYFGTELLSHYPYLGGVHGHQLSQLCIANFNHLGLVLFLMVTGLIMASFLYVSTIKKTRSLFGLSPYLQALYDKMAAWLRLRKQDKEEVTAEEEDDDEEYEDEEDEEDEVAHENVIAHKDEETHEEETPAATETTTVAEKPETPAKEEVAPAAAPEPAPSRITLPPQKVLTVKEAQEMADVTDENFTVITTETETVDNPEAATTADLPLEDFDPTAELSHYQFPTFDLLRAYNNGKAVDMNEQTENKEKIRRTLSDYGIEIQAISATVGPTITLFEIVLESGTKISRVKNLSDEIAMSIASKSGIRIIAPIPGKSAIGIEVPNNEPKTVSMRDCITSRAFQQSHAELPVALGKTITNEVFTFDLAKAPHLLVAGATGQGKSVGLNAIITSLLYKKHPSQLKIVLVDPKMVEFSVYKRIEKHYLAKLPDQDNPIITDVTRTVDVLQSLCAEMEDRYAMVEDAGVRNIKEYNEKFVHRHLNPAKHISAPLGSREGTHHRYLPYIVAIIDEYGDLIMTAGKQVELPIARIAQKARAVGIHLIIATQRPSAKIVTGIIKANFPARIAFRVSSSIDSSIILDQAGAQNLIGRGDLLFSTGNLPTRVQCAFVDTPEVTAINKFISDQQGYPSALILPEPKTGEEGDDGGVDSVDLKQLDPLFDECAQLVVASGQGSTSMIQRKFQIGYNRAGRIMDQLEAAGIVGPYSGSKARAVLITNDTELLHIIEDLKNR